MYKKFDNKSGRRTKMQHGSSSVKRVSHNGLPTTTKKKPTAQNTRQRMPHSGGYGGMFDDPDNSVAADSNYGDSYTAESATSQTTGLTSNNSESSSLSGSIFSFTSKLFSNKRYHRKKNPYHSGGNSIVSGASRTSRSTWQSSNEHFYNSFIHTARRTYIALAFRIGYFIQMFSIVGVFCMASLNYFIAMENNPGYARAIAKANGGNNSLQVHDNVWMEGGGLKNHHIPRLRMRHVDPIKFLYHDLHPNELLERAQEKLRESTRFGGELLPLDEDGDIDGEDIDGDADEMSRNINGYGGGGGEQVKGQGPFVYGWKSMPRQIYNDFSSGLSDDTKTIQNPHNTGYFHNKAEKKGMVAGGSSKNMQHEGDDGENRPPPKGTVAYVLPIPTCYAQDKGDAVNYHPYSPNHPRDESSFRDFAMMLRAMIHANSYRNSASGSVYDYKMHAIIHPRAKKCRSATEDLFSTRDGSEGGQEGLEDDPLNRGMVDRSVVLQNLGYHISLQYPPLSKSDLAGSDMHGVDTVDLIRLYAYELEEYDAVVLVDYDTLVVAPVDKAVDLIVDSSSDDDDNGSGQVNNIDAVFSWEHVPSLVNSKARASVINLSFFALRPSKDTFQKLLIRYKNAQFSEPRGWGTIGRGSFPGWMTTQGFLTYYYDEVANAAKVETNRCAFGNTGEKFNENNSILVTNGGKVDCTSRTADSQCKDCSKTKFRYVVVADLSYCRAAWECGGDEDGDEEVVSHDKILSSKLCRSFLKTWFNGRLQMEDVHPQLEKGNGKLCIDGKYQPMMLLKPRTSYKPNFLNRLG